MKAEYAAFLVSEEGRRSLEKSAALSGDIDDEILRLHSQMMKRRNPTPWTQSLRSQMEEAMAPLLALVEVGDARKRARARYPDADRLFFTPVSLSQATSPILAAYHAERLAPFGTVIDLGCSVGMDSLALAEAGASVIALDQDPARMIFARANAEARGVADKIQFVEADMTTGEWSADAAFWDPARRLSETGQRVSRHAEMYEPPLSFLQTIRGRVRGGAVKLSPALPDDVLENLNGRVEFLSENRECKEACLWFGAAHGIAGETPRAAVLLPERHIFVGDGALPPVGLTGPYLLDPDPAIIRAGALASLAEAYALRRLSPYDAYLTADALTCPPRCAPAYNILAEMPYKPRPLREWLRKNGYERLVVKKRHYPKEPDAIAKELRLKLSGDGPEITLVLVRGEGRAFRAILCSVVAARSAATTEHNHADF